MNDFLIELQSGVHTFELSQTLTKKQFTEILNCCHTRGRLIHNEEKKESYVLLDKSMPGVTVTLYPIRSRKTYRVNIKIEPCRVLGSDNPTALYCYSKKSYCKLREICDPYLAGLHIPGGIDTMAISRCDLTCNLIFPHQDYVDAYLRSLKKSRLIPDYRAVKFSKYEKKAKDPKRANKHSHCIRCSQAAFLCYDKMDQLKMIGRWTEGLAEYSVLRLEAQLKRPALKRQLGKEAVENNTSLLKAGTAQASSVAAAYLERMFPCHAPHLRYGDAVEIVRTVRKETLREQMLFLLKKTSGGAGLDTAVQKLKQTYKDVGDKQLKKIWDKFDTLGVNPISLTNDSQCETISSLNYIFCQII